MMSITNFEKAVLVNSGIEYENGRSLLYTDLRDECPAGLMYRMEASGEYQPYDICLRSRATPLFPLPNPNCTASHLALLGTVDLYRPNRRERGPRGVRMLLTALPVYLMLFTSTMSTGIRVDPGAMARGKWHYVLSVRLTAYKTGPAIYDTIGPRNTRSHSNYNSLTI